MTDLDNAITLAEACRRARISKTQFRTLRQQGKVPPHFKYGRVIYLNSDDVDRWITSRITPIQIVAS